MHSRVLTIILLALGLSVGSQVVLEAEAEAGPFGTLSKSRKGGKRTHKKAKSSKSKKSSSKRKSSSRKSSTSRRRVGSTTRRTSPSSRTNTRSRRTVRRSRPSSRRTSSRTSSRRTSSRRTSSRHTTNRRTTNVRPRTRTTTRRTRTVRRSPRRRGSRVRRTTYHRSSHHHHGSSSRRSSSRRSSSASRGGSKSAVEAYVTGGLGISGFASNEITDLPLPGAGYNLAVGAKSGIFGGELGFNGGGYTFDPANPSTDIGLVGLAADFKLQPSIGFFEPYAKAGIGGYSFADGIIDETASGVGLRLGAGADFRFRSVAFRLSYLHATYGLGDHNGGFGGSLTAHTETLGGNVVVYF